MICPLAVQRPITHNHGGPMRSHLGLVLHVQEGNGSLQGWFDNPSSGVSAHFWCAKDGTIEQYLSTDVTAWAEAAGNPDYISVETEGFVAEALTPNQIVKVAALLNWCGWMYGVPAVGPVAHGARGFTPHCNPDGSIDPAWGGHSCPGAVRLGQMPTILATAHQPEPTPPPSTEGSEEMDSVVAPNGDIVSHYRTPANHLLEVTRKSGDQGEAATVGLSIVDITAQYPQFEVTS